MDGRQDVLRSLLPLAALGDLTAPPEQEMFNFPQVDKYAAATLMGRHRRRRQAG